MGAFGGGCRVGAFSGVHFCLGPKSLSQPVLKRKYERMFVSSMITNKTAFQ